MSKKHLNRWQFGAFAACWSVVVTAALAKGFYALLAIGIFILVLATAAYITEEIHHRRDNPAAIGETLNE